VQRADFFGHKKNSDEPEPKFTTKVTPKAIATANSVNETAAGADR
jgi:hypothetical protein